MSEAEAQKSEDLPPPLEAAVVPEEANNDDNGPPPLEEVPKKDGEDSGMPELEEVKKGDGDEMPGLVDTKGDDVPPLDEPTKEEPTIPSGANMNMSNFNEMINAAQRQPIPGLKSQAKRSRSEKKAKKALQKNHKLSPVKDVTRVVIKQNKLLFIFEKPEVYKTGKKFYVIFGEASIHDVSTMSRNQTAERILQQAKEQEKEEKIKKQKEKVEEEEAVGGDDDMPDLETVKGEDIKEGENNEEDDSDDDSDDDLEGIEEKDIGVVCEQANVSRKKAIKALKASEGDVVDAVIQLQGGE